MSHTPQKTAIITGASRGIGAAIGKRLASDGFQVVINYASSRDSAEQVLREIETSGGTGIVVKADVSQADEVTALFDETISHFGSVDVLVNNAAIMTLGHLESYDEALFDKHIAVNLKGTFLGLQEAAKRVQNGGSIINISSSVVGLNLERYSVYAATKSAVETLTKILAKELRGKNITVNAVAPGPTKTDLFLDGKTDEFIEKLANMSPLERLGEPEDIASVVSFLAGPDGAWVNAQILRANGGVV